MSFAREGLVFICIAAVFAVTTGALALNRRSWVLWLVAFLLTILALCLAYFFRGPNHVQYNPGRFIPAAADTARLENEQSLVGIETQVDVFLPPGSTVRVKLGENTVAGATVIGELPTQ